MDMLKERVARPVAEELGLTIQEVASLFEPPRNKQWGDLALPCFKLAKKLGKNPVQIAGQLSPLFSNDPAISAVTAVGPFLNLTIETSFLAQFALEQTKKMQKQGFVLNDGEGKTVTIDFSSPNIAKEFSIAHLRSTSLGNSIGRIYRSLGWSVVGINHLGDWGTQFGLLIVAFTRWGSEAELHQHPLAYLQSLYVRINQLAKDDPEIMTEARANFKALEQGEAEQTRLWSLFRQVSLDEFDRMYAELDVSFEAVTGESYFIDKVAPLLAELEDKGITTVSDGALVVELEDPEEPPALLRKSDGATTYAARDVAAIVYRQKTYRFDRNIYLVDSRQALHFKQIFTVASKLGVPNADQCAHVPFGAVKLDGQIMATRKGNVMLLSDFISRVKVKVEDIMTEKNPDLKDKSVAAQVAIGAILFEFLKRHRIHDVDFRSEEALKFEGETGPRVQMLHARLCGLARHYKGDISEVVDFELYSTAEERELLKKMLKYPKMLRNAGRHENPAIVSDYLLELADVYSRFYAKVRIVTDDAASTAARMLLMDRLRSLVAHCLWLLGIKAVKEM